MYCPSCGKEISEGSIFCLHCGKRIDSPGGVPVQVQPLQVEWDYRDFVFKWAPKQIWVSVGRQGYTMPTARAWFWQEYQRQISSDLQTWLDAGWEPVGEVGPSSIEIRTYKDAKLSPIGWLFVLGFSIFTLFLPLLFIWDDYAEPTQFRLQMRAPKGTKIPTFSNVPFSASIEVVSKIPIDELEKWRKAFTSLGWFERFGPRTNQTLSKLSPPLNNSKESLLFVVFDNTTANCIQEIQIDKVNLRPRSGLPQ